MLNPSDVHILLVDDEAPLRETLAASFQAFKFNCHEASSLEEALKVLDEQENIQIILSDIRMPGGTGIDLLKVVREKLPHSINFYLMTGFDDLTLAEAYALGADGFFAKPFSIASVKSCIQSSFLSKEELWNKPPASTHFDVRKRYRSFEKMVEADDMSFGRSGVFFKLLYDKPQLKEVVAFEIEIQDLKPCRLISGTGIVRWVRDEEDDGAPAGIGVEINYLNPECRSHMIEWLAEKDTIASIPHK